MLLQVLQTPSDYLWLACADAIAGVQLQHAAVVLDVGQGRTLIEYLHGQTRRLRFPGRMCR